MFAMSWFSYFFFSFHEYQMRGANVRGCTMILLQNEKGHTAARCITFLSSKPVAEALVSLSVVQNQGISPLLCSTGIPIASWNNMLLRKSLVIRVKSSLLVFLFIFSICSLNYVLYSQHNCLCPSGSAAEGSASFFHFVVNDTFVSEAFSFFFAAALTVEWRSARVYICNICHWSPRWPWFHLSI